MTNIEKCLRIIQDTHDGDRLSPEDLRLTELAVNGQLSDRGQEALDRLYEQVVSGEYDPPQSRSFFNSPLTIKPSGYVYWRDICVEHYSYRDRDAERAAARVLAARCVSLEERGFPVSGRNASAYSPFADAPAGTPWVEAMSTYYAMFGKDGKPVELILYCDTGVAALRMENGQPVIRRSAPGAGAYEMFHLLQGEGLASMTSQLETYGGFVAAMEAAGISPEAVREARAGSHQTV